DARHLAPSLEQRHGEATARGAELEDSLPRLRRDGGEKVLEDEAEVRVRVLELLGVPGGGRVVESPLVVLPPLAQAHDLEIGGGGEGGHHREVVRREVGRYMTLE